MESFAPDRTSDTRVWFITGASSGFGKALAEAALERGERVVATARRPGRLEGLWWRFPSRTRTVGLDVTDPKQAHSAIAEAVRIFGRIDVVANNAGYGLVGAIEEATDEQIRQQFEVNVFGALNVTRAALPQLRRQRSGTLIQMSSVGGQTAKDSVGRGIYQSTKFALEGFSEALAEEVRPLGIRVMIVEPGDFRTDFLGHPLQSTDPIEDYAATVGADRQRVAATHGNQPGDPVRAARAILEVMEADEPPLRLPLGEDSLARIRRKLEAQGRELDRWESVTLSTAFASKAN